MIDKKWSFYKSVCIIDAISVVIFNLIIGYQDFLKGNFVNSADILGFIFLCLIFCICYLSDYFGIRLINSFSLNKGISNQFHKWNIASYILLCGFFLLLSYGIYKGTFDAFKKHYTRHSSVENTRLAVIGLFAYLVLYLTSLYKIILTWKLVKGVKKNYTDFTTTIDTIGQKDTLF